MIPFLALPTVAVRTCTFRAAAKQATRKQLASHDSTPACFPTLAGHGCEGNRRELNRLSKEWRWNDMIGLIGDDVPNEIAAVGERRESADQLWVRLDGSTDGVGITHNRCPDTIHRADVVHDPKHPP